MAVVGSVYNGEPRTFTCWYVYVDGKIYWKSRTQSEHSLAFSQEPKASLCIYDHNAQYPDNKTGLQILGEVHKVIDRGEMQKVLEKMQESFGDEVINKNNIEDLLDSNTKSTFYKFTPKKFKLVCKDFDLYMEHYETLD